MLIVKIKVKEAQMEVGMSKNKTRMLIVERSLLEESDAGHPLSVSAILDILENEGIEAERKSIMDDVSALRSFGYDIKHRNGTEGGYYIDKRLFSASELRLLVDAVQASKFVTEGESVALIEKISRLTSRAEAKRLRRLVYLPGRLRSRNSGLYDSIDIIQGAINSGRRISFRYFDYTSDKKRVARHGGAFYTVSPWRLCYDGENYYLIAYDGSVFFMKNFRVDRMGDLSVSELEREGKECFDELDLAEYTKKSFGMFGGREELITLYCDSSLTNAMIDRFGTDPTFFTSGDGFYFSVRVFLSPVFYSWLACFGGKAKITAPSSAIDEYRALLSSALSALEG